MTLFEFKLLPEDEQISRLYRQAVYIGKRKISNQIAVIYQLENFYAEVFYFSYRRNIAGIRCSESTFILDPYLEQINVEYLVG